MSLIGDVVEGSVQLVRAMGVTLKHLLSRPITVQYPEEPSQVFPRFRARHELRRDENGLERCVACGLCAAVCPSGAIYVEAAENDPEVPVSASERYAFRYEINMTRCIFCGYCQEACPTGAIVLGHHFELAEYGREALIYSKDRLLEKPAPRVVVKPDA